MKILRTYLFFISLILFSTRCSNNQSKTEENTAYQENEELEENIFREKELPLLKNLSDYKKTEFVPTLESNLSVDKNSIYCSTFLYAWDVIKKIIATPISITNSSNEMHNLNDSKSHFNTLDSLEYNTIGKIHGDTIEAQAAFSKSLPFKFSLSDFSGQKKLTFDSINVASFGMDEYEYEEIQGIKILYYKNDDNFIIKLLMLNDQHEFFLFKTANTFKTLKEYVSELNKNIEIGNKEIGDPKMEWKYIITNEDTLIIPKLNFNIENHYETIEGQQFKAKNKTFHIKTAIQRNAFIMDKDGVSIESESQYRLATVAVAALQEVQKPKHLKFDKPFFIMLRKKDSEYPYFSMRIMNSELMIKE